MQELWYTFKEPMNIQLKYLIPTLACFNDFFNLNELRPLVSIPLRCTQRVGQLVLQNKRSTLIADRMYIYTSSLLKTEHQFQLEDTSTSIHKYIQILVLVDIP